MLSLLYMAGWLGWSLIEAAWSDDRGQGGVCQFWSVNSITLLDIGWPLVEKWFGQIIDFGSIGRYWLFVCSIASLPIKSLITRLIAAAGVVVMQALSRDRRQRTLWSSLNGRRRRT